MFYEKQSGTKMGEPTVITLKGYEITDQIYESAKTAVYRGRRKAEALSVVVKIHATDYPSPKSIAKFRREYELGRQFDVDGVIKYHGVERYNNRLALIEEDFGAVALTEMIPPEGMDVPTFLKIAPQLAQTLGEVHKRQIIHKDIKPRNIVIDPTSLVTKLIDFGISSQLSREEQSVGAASAPTLLEGTLAYISPEQTGRMNRSVDYRADFYSLGVTFYEMLTGSLPFETQDPMELIYCHIAKAPEPPHERKPGIPPAMSALVMKLLSKTAEERYQSAYGLFADLQAIKQQLETKNQIETLVLGLHDVSDRFQIPQKLYGREVEIEKLLAAFDRISGGEKEMMLVSGQPGIGKSVLVYEIHEPIVRQRGYFISGKFDQYQRNIPYAALIQAFESLIQQLLAESQERIDGWREKLLSALGPNGQLIIDVIPDVELIIGSQPTVPKLPPSESQNRFNRVLLSFVRTFAQAQHPLAIFLDDLQWADSASLNLLERLIADAETRYLFLIGAYRDNEVSDAHPLILTLDAIQKISPPLVGEGSSFAVVNQIALHPLDITSLNRLIADTLHCELERAKPPAALVHRKTGGNPFFVNQFLTAIYEEGLLTFDAALGGWRWELSELEALGITDNVVELMAGKIQRLKAETQQVLQLAACIGNQFDLHTTAIVHEKSPVETAGALWEAIQEGLIVPIGDAYKFVEEQSSGAQKFRSSEMNPLTNVPMNSSLTVSYRFLHDRVQQAAYLLIPEARKKAVHLKIGRLMLENTPLSDPGRGFSPEERDERIFDIVNQLNLSVELINEQAERNELARLNLTAGLGAKAAAAYQPALTYFKIGLELLDSESWQIQYALTLALHTEAAEAAFLSGDFKEAEIRIDTVLKHGETHLDKVRAYETQIECYVAQSKPLEAVDTARRVLKLLGVSLPEKPSKLHVLTTLLEAQIKQKRVPDLKNLPEMTEESKLAAMRILISAAAAAYMTTPEMMVLMILKIVNLSLKFGNAPASTYAYATYGLVTCGVLGNIDKGYQLGTLALELLDKLDATAFKSKVYLVFYTFINHWKSHLKTGLSRFLEGYQSGLETGDNEYAALNALLYCEHAYLLGNDMTELKGEMEKYHRAIDQINQNVYFNYQRMFHQTVLNLMGESENPCRLIGDIFNAEEVLPHFQRAQDRTALAILYFNEMILSYLFEVYPDALKNAVMLEAHLDNMVATIVFSTFPFYDSLVRLAMYPSVEKAEQKRIQRKVAANQKKMKKYAAHGPMNYRHKYELVEAERARVFGDVPKAIDFYERAIASARENNYVNEEALVNELAAKFYLERGNEKIAQTYMAEARYAYQRWGAVAKVEHLDQRYPQLLPKTRRYADADIGRTVTDTLTSMTATSTTEEPTSTLDLNTVVKASQAISGEIVLQTLLEKMMRLMIENAGAQNGVLILEKAGELFIEAEQKVVRSDPDPVEVGTAEVRVLQSIPIKGYAHLPHAIINYVTRTRENVVLNDATHEGMFATDPYIAQHQPKSILCAPLIHQRKLTGLLYLENNLTTNVFTRERLEVLRLLSSQAAVSIENARLYTDLQASERKYRTLFEDSRDLIFITAPTGEIIDINPAGVNLLGDPREDIMQRNAADFYANPADRMRFRQEIEKNSSVRDFEVKVRRRDGIELDCLMTATLRQTPEGEILGYQGIVRDVTEQKRAERERLRLTAIERELTLAQNIQESLLPPAQPDWTWPEVICYSKPAREVGGDLYAYHAFAPSAEFARRYAITVGDASGKGMPAALTMAVSLASFQSLVGQGLAPGELLRHLGDTLVNYTRQTRQNFAMVYLEICQSHADSSEASPIYTLRAANAGGMIPLLKRVDGSVEWVEMGGLPLGVGLGVTFGYQEVTRNLSPDDLVILTSDGVVEASNAGYEIFGFERLEASVQSCPERDAAGMVKHLKAEVAEFVGGAEQYDDMTIVVVKV